MVFICSSVHYSPSVYWCAHGVRRAQLKTTVLLDWECRRFEVYLSNNYSMIILISLNTIHHHYFVMLICRYDMVETTSIDHDNIMWYIIISVYYVLTITLLTHHALSAQPHVIISSPWIWKGVYATLQSGRYTLPYPRGRFVHHSSQQ